MAKYLHGINGPFMGKVGTVTGCRWKSVDYMRITGYKRTKNISEEEQANRSRFSAAQYWLKPLKAFIREGFRGYKPTVEGFNAAKSYLMHHAMSGSVVDPGLVKVSYGNLPNAEEIAVSVEGDDLVFTWDNATVPDGDGRDQVMLLAYDVQEGFAHMNVAGAFRKTGREILSIGRQLPGTMLDIYVGFNAWNRTRQSTSEYLGLMEF
jgi:hypothetical protein